MELARRSATEKSRRWLALAIRCRVAHNEPILAALYGGFFTEGAEIRDLSDGVHNLIIAYFPEDEAEKADLFKKRVRDLEKFVDDIGDISFESFYVDEEDWANSWKKFFSPRKLGKRIIVTPTWEDFKPKKNELPIFIEPGMAFGTGHHETTHLCVKLLEEVVGHNDIVLDIGTGTGILAIAARLLGASLVVGTDNDKYAVAIARENIKLNKCDDAVFAFFGNLLSFRDKRRDRLVEQKCDVVVCNILKDAVLKLPPKLEPFVRPSTVVIVSGILDTQYDDVARAFAKSGYASKRHTQEKDWVACSFMPR